MTQPADHADRVLQDALARLVEAVLRHTATLARSRNLSPTDLRAIGLIDRAGAMRPGELAAALELSSSGTTAVIARLTGAGLLHRDSGPGNHRDVRLRTPTGTIDALGLAPAPQLTTACTALDLSIGERELIATFALQLLERIQHDTDTIRATIPRHRDHLPAPPRWA